MEPYRWSSLTVEDVRSWSALIATISDHDGGDEYYDPERLAEELGEHGVDPAKDTWAVWHGDELAAWCHVWIRTSLDHDGTATSLVEGGVHPDHRRRGLGAALSERAETRAKEMASARFPGVEGRITAQGGTDNSPARALLGGRGYRIERYFNLLRRPVSDPVSERPTLPGGVSIRAMADDRDRLRDLVLAARNDAFRDHWGSSPAIPQEWADRWSGISARPEVSVVAVDDSGRVLSYVLCEQYQPGELYVASVATVRDARGQGLARACLIEVLSRAAATDAYDHADLHVDSTNETGATGLYESLGWELVRRTAAMHRAL